MQILVATNNAGKMAEFQQLLDTDVEILSLRDVGLPSPPENGTTFEENAIIKAQTAAVASGLLAVADDSGLEVNALKGAPGVWSARYAGEGATDASNRALLLEKLDGVPVDLRCGCFVSVIAVCTKDGNCRTFRGEWEGRVALAERGEGGFGYDSVFELSDGRTVAELSPEEKNARSHRSIALEQALPWLQCLMNGAMHQGKDRA